MKKVENAKGKASPAYQRDLDKLGLMALPLAQASLALCFQKGKLAPKLSMVAELALLCILLAVVHLGFNL